MAGSQMRHQRIRFADFSIHRLPNGRCRSRVVLAWTEEEEFVGEAEGLGSQAGELRCAAEACVEALTQAVDGRATFDLLGAKAIRAFDAQVVIVSLAAHGMKESKRLVGSVLTESDVTRAAALAVLHATNRVLGNRVFMG